jgi:hypothetical protein
LLLALAVAPCFARAQDESLNQARTAFDEGQRFFVDGKFIEAALKFQEAYDARPFPQFLFNIAACYEKATKYSMALEFYSRYLKESPKAADRDKTQSRIEALKAGIRELDKAPAESGPPTAIQELEQPETVGLVVVESDPAGASIYLDDKKGEPISKTPWNGSLSGEHVILLERKGYKPVKKRISPDPSKLILVIIGMAEENYLGWLDVSANVPGAEIFIDNREGGAKAKVPWGGNIAPGKHKIWVTKDGYSQYATEIEVVAGQTYEVKAKLEGADVGYLNVQGKEVERVRILVDGEVLCERGPCIKSLSPGMHRVTVMRSGYAPYSRLVEIQSNTEMTLRATLEPEPSRRDAVVAYVLSALFAGGGAFAAMRSKEIQEELEAEIAAGNPPPDSGDPRFKLGKYYSWGANAGFALGGVTFLTALYYSFRDKGKPSSGTTDVKSISVNPIWQPGYAGIGLGARF